MRTLLIVEDDDDIFDYYRILLGELAVRIVRAATGREALALLDAGEPVDLILLDMVLPGMSGEDIFRALRVERGSGVPLVACSVDEALIAPLGAIGKLQGTFLKGNPGAELLALLKRLLAG